MRLHDKHGVNPTMPVCWWCGKDTGEIALLGAAYKGEAPHRMVINREPCPSCIEHHKQGLVLIEATAQEFESATGQWCVITREAAARLFNIDVHDKPCAFIEPAAWDKLGLPRGNTEPNVEKSDE